MPSFQYGTVRRRSHTPFRRAVLVHDREIRLIEEAVNAVYQKICWAIVP